MINKLWLLTSLSNNPNWNSYLSSWHRRNRNSGNICCQEWLFQYTKPWAIDVNTGSMSQGKSGWMRLRNPLPTDSLNLEAKYTTTTALGYDITSDFMKIKPTPPEISSKLFYTKSLPDCCHYFVWPTGSSSPSAWSQCCQSPIPSQRRIPFPWQHDAAAIFSVWQFQFTISGSGRRWYYDDCNATATDIPIREKMMVVW